MFWNTRKTSGSQEQDTQREAQSLQAALKLAEGEADNGRKILLFDDLATRATIVEKTLTRNRTDQEASGALLLVGVMLVTGISGLYVAGLAAAAVGWAVPGLWAMGVAAATMLGTAALGQKIVTAMTDRFDKKNGELKKTAAWVKVSAETGRQQVAEKGLPALAASPVIAEVFARFPDMKESFVSAALRNATPQELKELVTPKRPAANFTGVAA